MCGTHLGILGESYRVAKALRVLGLKGFHWDDGKENVNYYSILGLYWGYILGSMQIEGFQPLNGMSRPQPFTDYCEQESHRQLVSSLPQRKNLQVGVSRRYGPPLHSFT